MIGQGPKDDELPTGPPMEMEPVEATRVTKTETVSERVRAARATTNNFPAPIIEPDDIDPDTVLPREAAAAHLRHWYREPLAGALALIIGVGDAWFFGRDAGLTSSIDEILVFGGVVLIAGSRRLFGATPPTVSGGGAPKR